MKLLAGVCLVLAVVCASLTACSGDDEPSGAFSQPPGPAPSPQPRQPVTYQPPASRCRGPHQVPLTISTRVPLEVDYLRQVDACTNLAGTVTYLKNTGSAVWKPRARAAAATYLQDSLTASSYRAAVESTYDHPLLTPGQVMVVAAAPATVSWDLDLNLSLAWHGHEAVAEEIGQYGETALTAALLRRSPTGRALTGCTLSVLHVADDTDDLTEKDMSEWIMLGLGGSAKAATCTAAVQEAERAELQAGRRSTLTVARLPGIRTSQAAVLEDADSFLTQAARLGKVVALQLAK